MRFDDDNVIVEVEDGRVISLPIYWFPRLDKATLEQRSNYQLLSRGLGIHWPDLDEDVLTDRLFLPFPLGMEQK